jgi:hypothetical protein
MFHVEHHRLCRPTRSRNGTPPGDEASRMTKGTVAWGIE